PGPAGLYDVKIMLGGLTATLKDGFRYDMGGLKPPWQTVKMAHRRGEHPGLAVTQEGPVLVAGGTTVPDDFSTGQTSAELFDRDRFGQNQPPFFTNPLNTMSAGRCWNSNSSVTLLNRK